MNKKVNPRNILLSIIGDEYPQLTANQRRKLAKIVLKYMEVLEESKIGETADYLDSNYEILVELL